MTTFYKKVGRRYIPVSEYDNELTNSYPKGTHLTICLPGSTTRRYNVEPALVPMIAAGGYAEETISKVIMDKLSYEPVSKPVTPEQYEAWENMKKAWGDDLCRLQSGSIMEAVRAGVNAMAEEAKQLLENPALQQSYDNFILISKISKGK